MTSTNDGKDVKTNQTSGQKGKTYYIELYKSLEGRLSGECSGEERARLVCEAWCRVHSLCLHSAPSTHPHLLSWLQRHTSHTILQTGWQLPKSKEQHSWLEDAINTAIGECQEAAAKRNGVSLPWETQLRHRARWFLTVLPNPWGHPILKALLDSEGPQPSDKEVLEWLKEERGVMFVTRLRQLAAAKCDDLALLLAAAVMGRVRCAAGAVPDADQADEPKDKPECVSNEPTLYNILRKEAGFTQDVWDLLTDIEFVLLYKGQSRARCIELAKLTPLRNGYQLVGRLQNRLENSPREKKLWKNAKDVATLIAQVVIARCMVLPRCAGVAREALYGCVYSLVQLLPADKLPTAAAALAAPAATSRHLHTLAAAVHAQCKEERKPFVCSLYVRAITAGMNELEKLKLDSEKESEARNIEQILASWFVQIGTLLSASIRLSYECVLTAFSVHPSPSMYEMVKKAPMMTPLITPDIQEKDPETTSEFGSWANDSRTQTNLVKTSETLKLKHTHKQANVLSTTIFAEGEGLGLEADLCQDLAVLLSGPRVKTLYWDLDRDVLLENCRAYMERTHGGTRALTTELKYLHLDPDTFKHLPEEEDEDENDIYYGIEKGYEHLVEFEEPEPEKILYNEFLIDYSESTESASSADVPFVIPKRKKKKSKRPPSEEVDPLSFASDTLSENNDTPDSKERSKHKKDKSKKVDSIKDHDENAKSGDINKVVQRKDKKKEKKERKKKDKITLADIKLKKNKSASNLSRLVGMKIVRPISKQDRQNAGTNVNNACITDSDYDSQGKSSINSECNENVLIDGLYSMDDIKPPEETDKTLTDYSQRTSFPLFSYAPETVSTAQEDVKRGIQKLIEYRRNRVFNEYSISRDLPENQSPYNNSNSQSLPSNLHSPVISSKDVNIADSTNTSANKHVDHIATKLKTNFTNGKESLNICHQNAKGIQESSIRTVKKSSSKKPSPVLKQTVNKFAETPSQKQFQEFLLQRERNPIQDQIHSAELIGESVGQRQFQEFLKKQYLRETEAPVQPSYPQASERNDKPSHNTYQAQDNMKQQTDKINRNVSPSQNQFHNFLKELHISINAGATNDMPHSKSSPMSQPAIKKIIPPKKVDNAANTYSRLNYMHKNKQCDSKIKSTSNQITHNNPLVNVIPEQIQHIKDIDIKKVSHLQSTGQISISKVDKPRNKCSNENKKVLVQTIENISSFKSPLNNPVLPNMLMSSRGNNTQNYIEPQKNEFNVIKQCNEQSISSCSVNSNTTLDIPVLSNIVSSDKLRNTKNYLDSKKNEIKVTKQCNKPSNLSEKDQLDLLLLLRQQNNMKPPTIQVNRDLPTSNPSILNKPTVSVVNTDNQYLSSSQINVPYHTTSGLSSISCPTSVIKVTNNNTLNSGSEPKQTRKGSKQKSKTESDWKSVMDDLLAHKTPSSHVGPNAMDIVLKKDSFEKRSSENFNNPNNEPVTASSTNPNIIANNDIVKQPTQKTNADISTSNESVYNLKPALLLADMKQKEFTIIQSTNKLPSSSFGTKNELLHGNVKHLPCIIRDSTDPFISGIPNSDYDLLEELINRDDELRQEIEELSSADESYQSPNLITAKNNLEMKESNPPTDKATVINMNTTGNKFNYKFISGSTSVKITSNTNNSDVKKGLPAKDISLPKSIVHKNPDPANDASSKPQILSNELITSSTPLMKTLFGGKCQNVSSTKLSGTGKTTCQLKKSPVITMRKTKIPKSNKISANACNNSNLDIRKAHKTNIAKASQVVLDPAQVILTVPQRNKAQNVMLIGSDYIYDPFSTVHVNQSTNSSNFSESNSNTFVAMNQVPMNVALLQTTPIVAPVLNPVIIERPVSSPVIQNVTTKSSLNLTVPNYELRQKSQICKEKHFSPLCKDDQHIHKVIIEPIQTKPITNKDNLGPSRLKAADDESIVTKPKHVLSKTDIIHPKTLRYPNCSANEKYMEASTFKATVVLPGSVSAAPNLDDSNQAKIIGHKNCSANKEYMEASSVKATVVLPGSGSAARDSDNAKQPKIIGYTNRSANKEYMEESSQKATVVLPGSGSAARDLDNSKQQKITGHPNSSANKEYMEASSHKSMVVLPGSGSSAPNLDVSNQPKIIGYTNRSANKEYMEEASSQKATVVLPGSGSAARDLDNSKQRKIIGYTNRSANKEYMEASSQKVTVVLPGSGSAARDLDNSKQQKITGHTNSSANKEYMEASSLKSMVVLPESGSSAPNLDDSNEPKRIGHANSFANKEYLEESSQKATVVLPGCGSAARDLNNSKQPKITGHTNSSANKEYMESSSLKAMVVLPGSGSAAPNLDDSNQAKIIGHKNCSANKEYMEASSVKATVVLPGSGSAARDLDNAKQPKIIGYTNSSANEEYMQASSQKATVVLPGSGSAAPELDNSLQTKILGYTNFSTNEEYIMEAPASKATVVLPESGSAAPDFKSSNQPKIIEHTNCSARKEYTEASTLEATVFVPISEFSATDIHNSIQPTVLRHTDCSTNEEYMEASTVKAIVVQSGSGFAEPDLDNSIQPKILKHTNSSPDPTPEYMEAFKLKPIVVLPRSASPAPNLVTSTRIPLSSRNESESVQMKVKSVKQDIIAEVSESYNLKSSTKLSHQATEEKSDKKGLRGIRGPINVRTASPDKLLDQKLKTDIKLNNKQKDVLNDQLRMKKKRMSLALTLQNIDNCCNKNPIALPYAAIKQGRKEEYEGQERKLQAKNINLNKIKRIPKNKTKRAFSGKTDVVKRQSIRLANNNRNNRDSEKRITIPVPESVNLIDDSEKQIENLVENKFSSKNDHFPDIHRSTVVTKGENERNIELSNHGLKEVQVCKDKNEKAFLSTKLTNESKISCQKIDEITSSENVGQSTEPSGKNISNEYFKDDRISEERKGTFQKLQFDNYNLESVSYLHDSPLKESNTNEEVLEKIKKCTKNPSIIDDSVDIEMVDLEKQTTPMINKQTKISDEICNDNLTLVNKNMAHTKSSDNGNLVKSKDVTHIVTQEHKSLSVPEKLKNFIYKSDDSGIGKIPLVAKNVTQQLNLPSENIKSAINKSETLSNLHLVGKKMEPQEQKSILISSIINNTSTNKSDHLCNKKVGKSIKPTEQTMPNQIKNTLDCNNKEVLNKDMKLMNDLSNARISIEDIPNAGIGPLKRCLRIKLPNGNAFKATISGKINVNINSIFEDPVVKSLLWKNINNNSKCTLNIKQVAIQNKNKEILKTEVKNVTYPKSKPIITTEEAETINLISDDEEDDNRNIFKTEFGNFNIASLDPSVYEKHQKKLAQKSVVVLERCNVFNEMTPVLQEGKSCDAGIIQETTPILQESKSCDADIIQETTPILQESKSCDAGIIQETTPILQESKSCDAVIIQETTPILQESKSCDAAIIQETTPILQEGKSCDRAIIQETTPILQESKSCDADIIQETTPILQESKSCDAGIIQETTPILQESKSCDADIIQETTPILQESKSCDAGIIQETTPILQESKSCDAGIIQETTPILQESKSCDAAIIQETTPILKEGKSCDRAIIQETTPILQEGKSCDAGIIQETATIRQEDKSCDAGIIQETTPILQEGKSCDAGIIQETTPILQGGKSCDAGIIKETTPILQEGKSCDAGTNIVPRENLISTSQEIITDYIEIDDSSNDSFSFISSVSNTNENKVVFCSEKVDELKNLLLKDLGVFDTNEVIQIKEPILSDDIIEIIDITNDTQTNGSDINIDGAKDFHVETPHSSQARPIIESNSKQCLLKIKKCDDLAEKLLKIQKYKCFVRLTRCDETLQESGKKNNFCTNENVIDKHLEDETVIDELTLKRSDSLSILNEFHVANLDEIFAPVSPSLIGNFEIPSTMIDTHLNSSVIAGSSKICDADWFITKSILNKYDSINNSQPVTIFEAGEDNEDTLTDCSDDLDFNFLTIKSYQVPTLLKLTVDFIAKNFVLVDNLINGDLTSRNVMNSSPRRKSSPSVEIFEKIDKDEDSLTCSDDLHIIFSTDKYYQVPSLVKLNIDFLANNFDVVSKLTNRSKSIMNSSPSKIKSSPSVETFEKSEKYEKILPDCSPNDLDVNCSIDKNDQVSGKSNVNFLANSYDVMYKLNNRNLTPQSVIDSSLLKSESILVERSRKDKNILTECNSNLDVLRHTTEKSYQVPSLVKLIVKFFVNNSDAINKLIEKGLTSRSKFISSPLKRKSSSIVEARRQRKFMKIEKKVEDISVPVLQDKVIESTRSRIVSCDEKYMRTDETADKNNTNFLTKADKENSEICLTLSESDVTVNVTDCNNMGLTKSNTSNDTFQVSETEEYTTENDSEEILSLSTHTNIQYSVNTSELTSDIITRDNNDSELQEHKSNADINHVVAIECEDHKSSLTDLNNKNTVQLIGQGPVSNPIEETVLPSVDFIIHETKVSRSILSHKINLPEYADDTVNAILTGLEAVTQTCIRQELDVKKENLNSSKEHKLAYNSELPVNSHLKTLNLPENNTIIDAARENTEIDTMNAKYTLNVRDDNLNDSKMNESHGDNNYKNKIIYVADIIEDIIETNIDIGKKSNIINENISIKNADGNSNEILIKHNSLDNDIGTLGNELVINARHESFVQSERSKKEYPREAIALDSQHDAASNDLQIKSTNFHTKESNDIGMIVESLNNKTTNINESTETVKELSVNNDNSVGASEKSEIYDHENESTRRVESNPPDNSKLQQNVTLVYKGNCNVVLKGSIYEDPVVGTCYVFPVINKSFAPEMDISNVCDDRTSNVYDDKTINVIETLKSKAFEDCNELNIPEHLQTIENLNVMLPKFTYSKQRFKNNDVTNPGEKTNRKFLKRKMSVSCCENIHGGKRYRKGKNIDYPKFSAVTMLESAYSKEYKRLMDYCTSIKFSYSQPFHKEYVDVPELLKCWPIKENEVTLCDDTDNQHVIFTEDQFDNKAPFDPLQQTLAEEISQCKEQPYIGCDINETNFNMGFGEGSDRVIQISEDENNISKVSAATLSDVKQSQPFLTSEDYVDYNKNKILCMAHEHQIEILRRSLSYIQLRDKVRAFFKKTTAELNYNWFIENMNSKYKNSNNNIAYLKSGFPYDLVDTEFIEPAPVEAIVQVVQVGQLPVSAAAQNPVTCDPRVTQVTDASPQCSIENSPHGDSQSPIKTEYTELTTADLSLPPLVQEYDRQMESQESSKMPNNHHEDIPVETEITSIVKTEITVELSPMKEEPIDYNDSDDLQSLVNKHINNVDYSFDSNDNSILEPQSNTDMSYESLENHEPDFSSPQEKHKNGSIEKTDQIAHAMNAAGITTTPETMVDTRPHSVVNMLPQKNCQQVPVTTTTSSANSYSKTAINAMTLQQALAQILPPPLNQTNVHENNQTSSTVTPQVLHIVQGKNTNGNQITLVDNTQNSVINNTNTPMLHIVQNKAANTNSTPNPNSGQHTNSYSGLSLVDAGIQQGSNQLLHIVNTGNQKNNATGQLLKRVNLLTNLANVQGPNEQKMVQFVCKSADGKSIHLNAPHQRSMVLRLQPIESNIQQPTSKTDSQDNTSTSPSSNNNNNIPLNKETTNGQHEIKSRSVYEENYAKFIQNSSNKTVEKSTSLPKFGQAFGKQVYQDGNQKSNEINANNSNLSTTNSENAECQPNDNSINLDQIGQINSPPLLLRKSPSQPTQSQPSQPNLVQQIKQTIAPMNIQTMHGGVIYTRQIPVNIGGGQTINLITVPSTELIDDQKQKVNQNELESQIIKIVPQNQNTQNAEGTHDDANNHTGTSNESAQSAPTQHQPVLTQMRIKLPMLSKTPQMVSGTRVVRPSFFQIQRNVIGGANQHVYQQLVLTAAPPLGQHTIRLPQAQASRPVSNTNTKSTTEGQSTSEHQMSSSTLEQLREFDMVLEQVKERSTVQPNSNNTFTKLLTPTTETSESTSVTSTVTESTQQVLYSIGSNQSLNVAYINRKTVAATPTTSTFVRSPDSSGIIDSPSSSHVQIPHTVTSESTVNEASAQSAQPKPAKVGSKSKSRPKSSSNPPSSLKINTLPPKPSTQKPLEDEQTTQRILYILAEYKEQVENSPDKDKPAPRRRSNPPTNPSGSSKRKKSSSGSRRPGARDTSPVHGEDTCRTMGSEDSSCGTSQGDCNESCLDSHSPQDSPRKVVRKLTFESETPPAAQQQPRPQPQRNVIVADGQTITVARGTAGKPATAVLMPANYILPVSMVKGGQQIAIVTNRGPKLLTVGGGEGGATNALLLQRLIGPAGLKPVLTRPGVRHVRLPTAALHNLQAFNLTTATTVQPPDSTASPAPAPTPPELIETRANASPWTDRENQDVKPERESSPEGSEPWNIPSSAADPQDYTYEETVRTDNMDRTVLEAIPDRYSPDMEAQRIFDKMFDVESKKSYIDSHDDASRCAYDIDDDKVYHQVVHKKDGTSQRHHRLTHVSAAALRHKYAILEHELRLQKSLSEECEDLGVDSPSASELFPEAELLFAASPAHDAPQHSHTPQPTILNQSGIPQPDIDDQIATDELLQQEVPEEQQELDVTTLGLDEGIVTVSEDGMQATIALDQEEFARSHPNTTFHSSEPTDEGELDVTTLGLDEGIVTVSEDGMQATIALDQEEFARSHPNTTFHSSEPTDEGEVQPFTIAGLKGRHITSTIFHAGRAPATVLVTAPQTTVISQAAPDHAAQNNVKYASMDQIINSSPSTHGNLNMPSVLVKDDGLTKFDNILTDSRELHLSNTASAIVHSTGNATQVIRRVCYEDDKRDARFLMDEPDALIAGDYGKIAEDSSRDATLESIAGDDDNSSPERHAELFWESNSASERSESRRPMDFSSDSEKCCKSPSYDETNSTDSSGVGTHLRLDSVIKEARGIERSASADGSSADDTHPPLRTYPAKRMYHALEGEMERSVSGKTRAGERSPDNLEGRRRASGRGVVKRGCHCCTGSPPRPKKPRQRKPTMDFNN